MVDHRTYGRRMNDFRRACRAAFEAIDAPCQICGQPIDYAAARFTPNALEVDHILPVITHPELEFEPSNVRPTHERCNRHRGAARAVPELGTTSAEW